MIKVAILGSTGSIGIQALEVISECAKNGASDTKNYFEVVALAAGGNSEQSVALFEAQCREFLKGDNAKNCALSAKDGFDAVVALANVQNTGADIVLNGIAGNIGLEATLEALKSGGKVALANKESLVIGGTLIQALVPDILAKIVPVDSEHSAIWQALNAGRKEDIDRLILTASGGPFFAKTETEMQSIGVVDALEHPTWQMGPLVTINSSTLMNKALELIEAAYLFDIEPSKIEVVQHPQSVVHSMVQYIDGAIISEQSVPSMKIPIALALSHPKRLPKVDEHYSFAKPCAWEFNPIDNARFPAINIVRDAFDAGPLYLALMNTVNERAVQDFLAEKLAWKDIIPNVQRALENFEPREWASNPAEPTLEEILAVVALGVLGQPS